jgi:hypothetical protein
MDYFGETALLIAATSNQFAPQVCETVQWLLEHGGANIMDTTTDGQTVWDALEDLMIDSDRNREIDSEYDFAAVTPLLRVMLLRDAPPGQLVIELSIEHKRIVVEWARLRAELPAYLLRRRALLDSHYPLIAPLRDLAHGYEVPTTTEELWATGLGAKTRHAKRTHPDGGDKAPFIRRSTRLRQRLKEGCLL